FSLLGKTKIPLGIKPVFRIMKLTSLLLLTVCLHLITATRSQTISLNVKNQRTGQGFQAIEKKTSLMEISNDRLLIRSTPVSIHVNDMSLTKALEVLLKPVSLAYHITENTIVITERATSSQPASIPVAPLPQRIISGQVTD